MSAKPATSLPWGVHDHRSSLEVWGDSPASGNHRAVCELWLRSSDTSEGEHATNAAYIVHAANAYPRLVAALRDLASAVSKIQTVTEADQKAVALPECRARALLRELGEL